MLYSIDNEDYMKILNDKETSQASGAGKCFDFYLNGSPKDVSPAAGYFHLGCYTECYLFVATSGLYPSFGPAYTGLPFISSRLYSIKDNVAENSTNAMSLCKDYIGRAGMQLEHGAVMR